MKISIVDSSPGNGHLFSFPAIFNGYNPHYKDLCPFPIINEYLPLYDTPNQSLANLAQVTNIWMPNVELAKAAAKFANIPTVNLNLVDAIEGCDVIIITNDEPIGREQVLNACIATGKEVFVDKLLARNFGDLSDILSKQNFKGQIYSAAATRFAPSFKEICINDLVENIKVTVPNHWDKYGIHAIELILSLAKDSSIDLQLSTLSRKDGISRLFGLRGKEQRIEITLSCSGIQTTEFLTEIRSKNSEKKFTMPDPFYAFSNMLEYWITRDKNRTAVEEEIDYFTGLRILLNSPRERKGI